MIKEQLTIYIEINVSKDKLAVALAGGGQRHDAVSLSSFETAPPGVDRLLEKLSARSRCGSTISS